MFKYLRHNGASVGRFHVGLTRSKNMVKQLELNSKILTFEILICLLHARLTTSRTFDPNLL